MRKRIRAGSFVVAAMLVGTILPPSVVAKPDVTFTLTATIESDACDGYIVHSPLTWSDTKVDTVTFVVGEDAGGTVGTVLLGPAEASLPKAQKSGSATLEILGETFPDGTDLAIEVRFSRNGHEYSTFGFVDLGVCSS